MTDSAQTPGHELRYGFVWKARTTPEPVHECPYDAASMGACPNLDPVPLALNARTRIPCRHFEVQVRNHRLVGACRRVH